MLTPSEICRVLLCLSGGFQATSGILDLQMPKSTVCLCCHMASPCGSLCLHVLVFKDTNH
jgi:hypothetical protein